MFEKNEIWHYIILNMIKRILDLSPILSRKSLFLFGPRQSGKTTFLQLHYPDATFISLLMGQTYRTLQTHPEKLHEMIKISEEQIVIIDEVQKIPKLLDEVQNIIHNNPKIKFILTGSSARKLKHGGGNLLGGRASWVNFFPFCYPELILISEKIVHKKIEQWLETGCLPSIIFSQSPWDDLEDYVNLYLAEEIKQETNIRRLDQFTRFLEVAAINHGQQIIFSNIGNDAQVKAKTVRDYFQVLEDTLIATLVPSFQATTLRKPMFAAKLYFFDQGVVNTLVKRKKISQGTPEFGLAFEHFVFKELSTFNQYKNKKLSIKYWRTTSKIEVDFIVSLNDIPLLAIEVKGKENIVTKDLKGLLAFKEEYPKVQCFIICLELLPRTTADNIYIIHWEKFMDKLWKGDILNFPE